MCVCGGGGDLRFVLQRKLHTSIPKTKNLKQLCSFLKTYVFNK